MEAQENVKPKQVNLSDRDLKIMWGLISTREWPISMIPEISHIKNVVTNALKVEDESKSTD